MCKFGKFRRRRRRATNLARYAAADELDLYSMLVQWLREKDAATGNADVFKASIGIIDGLGPPPLLQ